MKKLYHVVVTGISTDKEPEEIIQTMTILLKTNPSTFDPLLNHEEVLAIKSVSRKKAFSFLFRCQC